MEKYLNIDILKSESSSLQMLEEELDQYIEKYDNYIILTDKKYLIVKNVTPIKTLKILVEEEYNIEFDEKRTLILEISDEKIIRDMFEEKENVEREVYILMNKEGIIIDFNK